MEKIVLQNLSLFLDKIYTKHKRKPKKKNILILTENNNIIEHIKKSNYNFFIYILTKNSFKNKNNIFFIKNLKNINNIKFSFILHVSGIVDYYFNNYIKLLDFSNILLHEGYGLSLINSNVDYKKFNKVFANNYNFIKMYPVNNTLSLVYFKKIPLHLKININLLDIPDNQVSIVNKIHDFLVNTINFSTIPNSNIINENINICDNQVARGINIALLKLKPNIDNYLKNIGCKSRNMIKKSQKNNYYCNKINPDEYLDDIYEINTSKEFRQGKRMTDGYVKYPTKFNLQYNTYSEKYCLEFYGVFKDNKLVGYGLFYFCDELVVLWKLLGHGEHLKYGIMNLLFYFIVNDCIENHKHAKYINYLTIYDNNSNSKFKMSVGFKKYKYLIVNKELK